MLYMLAWNIYVTKSPKYIMGGVTYFTVFILCLLQYSNCAKPIFEEDQQYVYMYQSNVITKNAASNEHISDWTVTGKLIVQSQKDQVIMKLDDLKTKVFNGLRANLNDAEERKIPIEANALLEPFVVHYYEDNGKHNDIKIFHQPNEPLWSLNMKRAIGSIFQVKEDEEMTPDKNTNEASIYGICEVTYSSETLDDKKIVEKTLKYDSCDNNEVNGWSNVKPHGNRSAIEVDVLRTYFYKKIADQYVIDDVEASANMTYRILPSLRSYHQIEQKQLFKLLEQTKIETPLDTAKYTKKSKVIYETDYLDDTLGRNNKQNRNQKQLLQDFETAFKEFEIYFKRVPIQNPDVRTNDTLDEMYTILSEFDDDFFEIEKLSEVLGENELKQNVFISLLPYVGENSTVKFIRDAVVSDQLNDLVLIKLLTSFPIYVTTPTIDLVEGMEVLMDLNVSNPQVKYAGLLSFASLVADTYQRGDLTEEQLIKYMKVYNKRFQNAENYEERLNYLLGLFNFANAEKELSYDFVSAIVFNASESKYLRSLTINRLGELLINQFLKEPTKLYKMIRDRSEPFIVQIAAADLILSKFLDQLSNEQIEELFTFKSKTGYLQDIYDRHIRNFLHTTITSIETTDRVHQILDEKLKKRASENKAWSTGNYYVGYEDSASNFGAGLRTKLFANPVTNIINGAEIEYEHHGMSLNFGKYTIHIKAEGVLEELLKKMFVHNRPNSAEAIPKLLELIKTYGYEMKESEEFRVEIVQFFNDRAMFGIYIDKDNLENYAENPLFIDFMKILVHHDTVSYPMISSEPRISDLGTGITVTNEIIEVHSHDLSNMEELFFEDNNDSKHTFTYRSLWAHSMILSIYDPIDDITMNAYKYLNNEKYFKLPLLINKTTPALAWIEQDDGFNFITDHLLGTYIEGIEEHCSKCDEYNELPMGEFKIYDPKWDEVYQVIGVKLNMSKTENNDRELFGEEKYGVNYISNLIPNSKTNLFPIVKFGSFLMNFKDYDTYLLHDSERMSLRTSPYHDPDDPVESVLTMAFDIDDIYNEHDPINGTELTASFTIDSRKVKIDERVQKIDFDFKYVAESKTNNETKKSHHTERHFARINVAGRQNGTVCFDSEISFPERRSDKYSIIPVEPAKGKTIISWGKETDSDDLCPSKQFLKFSSIYTTTEDLIQKVKEMKQYKECKNEMAGLKYITPTDACLDVFGKMSFYNSYKLYGDFRNVENPIQLENDVEETNYGKTLMTFDKNFDNTFNYTYSEKFFGPFPSAILNHNDMGKFGDLIDLSPGVESYNDETVRYGFTTLCEMTPHNIETFTTRMIPNYADQFGKEFVAFVECNNETRIAMRVQILNKYKLGFTLDWGKDTLTATVQDDKLKVVLNGNELKQNEYEPDEHLGIYFMEDDVIYVTTNAFDIYYNTEFMTVKAVSVFNGMVCGVCSIQ